MAGAGDRQRDLLRPTGGLRVAPAAVAAALQGLAERHLAQHLAALRRLRPLVEDLRAAHASARPGRPAGQPLGRPSSASSAAAAWG